MKPWLLSLFFWLVTAGSAAIAEPLASVALPADLDRVLRDYERAWVANDPAALAALFTADGMALPNGQPPARGPDAIRKAYSQGAGGALSLRAIAYQVSGDLAYIIGGFGAAPGKPDFGKFVLVLRRASDGRWRLLADIDNTNRIPAQTVPPAPASPPS